MDEVSRFVLTYRAVFDSREAANEAATRFDSVLSYNNTLAREAFVEEV